MGSIERPEVVIQGEPGAKIGPTLKLLFDEMLRGTNYPTKLTEYPEHEPNVAELFLGER